MLQPGEGGTIPASRATVIPFVRRHRGERVTTAALELSGGRGRTRRRGARAVSRKSERRPSPSMDGMGVVSEQEPQGAPDGVLSPLHWRFSARWNASAGLAARVVVDHGGQRAAQDAGRRASRLGQGLAIGRATKVNLVPGGRGECVRVVGDQRELHNI